MMTDPGIRTATDADWPQIWPFWQRIVADGETYAYPDDLTSEQARTAWLVDGIGPGAGTAVVLEEDGRILGTARMGPNRPGRGAHVGTASFMVDENVRGRSVGRRLAEYAIRWHRNNQFRAIQFNAVVETNLAAIRLWESLGFRIVGTVPAAFRSRRHGYVALHVMLLPLE